MGKYLTSLLILASSLLLPDEIFADEQVRRVQEELRKRHLFYENPNGEKGAALTLALKRYQEKKGFPRTGHIDSVTLASLGLSTTRPLAAATPTALGKHGQVHGANGETLPTSPPFLRPNNESVGQFDPAILGRDYVELDLADFHRQATQRRRTFGRGVGPRSSAKDFGAPLEARLDSTSEGISYTISNSIWSTLALQPTHEVLPELGEIDDERTHRAAIKPDRRSPRRTRRAGPRKEKNPFVLTYHSLDRAIRSLFGDAQTKKKRSTGKRM